VTDGRRQRLPVVRRAVFFVLLSLAVGASATLIMALRPRGSTATPPTPEPLPPRQRPSFAQTLDVRHFVRGNIHTHSAVSDGDSPAEVVIRWYRDHGYQFVALTDHNRLLDVTRYRHLERDDFVLIPGEEVTLAASGRPVHVNALCTRQTIGGKKVQSRLDAMQWAVDAVLAQGGVAMINHPNFAWALDARLIGRVRGAHLLEIYNGHPLTVPYGDHLHPSVESMWDELLAEGSTLAPAAVDDMHMLGTEPMRGVAQSFAGTGWVEVFTGVATRDAICHALSRGQLYASNGPRLVRFVVDDDAMSLWIERDERAATVDFLGTDGELLASVIPVIDDSGDRLARYELRGEERVVRARVDSIEGHAWTPAYRVR
jgi:hypothetical protein